MHLALVTDAWFPQVNGVVHSLNEVVGRLRRSGDAVSVISPQLFRTMACPGYPEISLALATPGQVGNAIERCRADHIHIATEGPLGVMARRYALRTGRGFTTSYHTKFPEYLAARLPVPLRLSYALIRRFHNAGLGCMTATASLREDLRRRGFERLMRWPRGVDANRFHPRRNADLGLPRPVFLSVGRVAVEKNLEAFLSLDLPGSKVVVGDGPARRDLENRYPEAVFLGMLRGEALARAYAAADVFVFPSLTDTFGNVMLEALASGLPVAAFPVTGLMDVIVDPEVGVLDQDLRRAALAALDLSSESARRYALRFSWEASARAFRDNILNAHRSAERAAVAPRSVTSP